MRAIDTSENNADAREPAESASAYRPLPNRYGYNREKVRVILEGLAATQSALYKGDVRLVDDLDEPLHPNMTQIFIDHIKRERAYYMTLENQVD
jgi:hypothetical protein